MYRLLPRVFGAFNIVLLLSVWACLTAQPKVTLVPRFINLGVEEGLSQSAVTDVFQDKKGYLWFGTPDGLNRYDGENIDLVRYTPTKSGTPVSNYVPGHISEDTRGQIWYANETGIFCCNPGTLKVERVEYPEGEKKIPGALGIYFDINSKVYWVFMPGVGLMAYNTGTKTFETFKITNTKRSTDKTNIEVDNLRQIWIPLESGTGIYAFNTKDKSYKLYLPNRQVLGVFAQAGRYFFYTADGVLTSYTLNQVRYSFGTEWPAQLADNITEIVEDPYKRIWISTRGKGLWCYDPHSGRATQYTRHFQSDFSLPGDDLTGLFIDHTANLWVCTRAWGLSKLDLKPPRFKGFPLDQSRYAGIYDFSIQSLCEAGDGSVWFGARSGGLFRFSPEQETFTAILPPHANNVFDAFFRDKNGRLWAGHHHHISIIDERKNRVVPAITLEENSIVHAMAETDRGEILAATSRGLCRLSSGTNGKWSSTYAEVSRSYSDVLVLPGGDIWAAGDMGLHRFERTGDGSLILKERFLEQIKVFDLHLSSQAPNVLWLASNNGLLAFDTGTRQLDVRGDKGGLNSQLVYAIQEDGAQRLWVSTNRGLSSINPGDPGAYFANFSIVDGLQNVEFNPGVSWKGAGGTLYFGGIHGFNWFKWPLQKDTFSFKPKVDIDKIYINGQMPVSDLLYASKLYLDLPFDKNDLTFKFAALDFSRPSANKVQYRLEGKDADFITQKEKTVHFVNLKPGNYKLHVMAGNGFGDWSVKRTLDIRIRYSFWKYIGVDLLVFLISVLLGFAVYFRNRQQYRRLLEKQQAIEKDRIRIAKDMHDEIGSGLTRIAHLTDIIDPSKVKDPKVRGYLEDIGRSSRKLVSNIGEIIWSMNPKQDTLDSLLAYLREQSYQFFEPFESVRYQIFFPDEVPHLELSNQQRRNLFYTAKESLNNALKHADASEIELYFSIEGGRRLCFEVRDNGKGMVETEKKQLTGGFGLPNLRRRIEEIGGQIYWESAPGQGTRVIFYMTLPPPLSKPFENILNSNFLRNLLKK